MEHQRLPSCLKPFQYDLELFDIQLQAPFSYQGKVHIYLKVNEPTDTVWLNSKDLVITNATATSDSASSLEVSQKSYHDALQRVSLRFSAPLSGPEAKIAIQFTGAISDSLVGFYRTSAPGTVESPEKPHVFSTIFESCHARKAFPCFDEPNLKARFNFSICIPQRLTVLSNMPEKEVVVRTDGYKLVSFETTPLMSTYLLGWAIGEFEYIESTTNKNHMGKRLPVRIYTTKGLISQAQYALHHACRVMDYFASIFGIDYPLPKLDLIVIPEFAHGAMENWGLCTFQATTLLVDDTTSTPENRERASYVIAHELAHQWFGNLVTMDWWNDLWLKEGFATWAGWLAADHFHPDWNIWHRFVSDGLQTAFQLDSLGASHPVDVQVKDGPDIDEIFDDISYLKGSSLIRMLVNYLGRGVFFKGIRSYLQAFAYKNAQSQDLWRHLSQASGKDVQSFMDLWIHQTGFPVITVELDETCVVLRQERHLLTGDPTSAESESTWWIPLSLTLADGKIVQEMNTKLLCADLDSKSPAWKQLVKLNPDRTGFYRINYPSDIFRDIAANQGLLTVEEKVCLIADAVALATTGKKSTGDLLSLIDSLYHDTDYFVWFQISKALDMISSRFSENVILSRALNNFKNTLIKDVMPVLDWEISLDEEPVVTKRRALLILMAGTSGHKDTLDKCFGLFESYISDPSTLHSSLLPAIFTIVSVQGDIAQYKRIKSIYLNAPPASIDLKETCLKAMASTSSPEALADYLDFLLSPDVLVVDLPTAASALATRAFSRNAFWKWLQENWEHVLERFNGTFLTLDLFFKQGLSGLAEESAIQVVESFFREKDCEAIGFARGFEVVLERIKVNVDFKRKQEKALHDWLRDRGYLA